MQSVGVVNTFVAPLASPYVAFPSIPYPYRAVISNYLYMRQANPNFSQNFLDGGYETVSSLAKNSVWPGRFVSVGGLLVNFVVSKFFNYIWKITGILESKRDEHDFSLIIDAIKLKLYFDNLQYNVEARELYQSQEILGNETVEDRLQQIAETEQMISSILFNIESIKTKVNNKIEKFEEFHANPKYTPMSTKESLKLFITSTISNTVTNAITYPFQMISLWYIANMKIVTWGESATLLYESVKSGEKFPLDGLLVNTVRIMLQKCLVIPPMIGFKKLFNIPNEIEMKFYKNYFFMTVFTSELPVVNKTHEEKKELLVHSFNMLVKNSVAFSISNWFASLILYPLTTIQTRLTNQGIVPENPKYSNTADCILQMYSKDRMEGFFGGFSLRAFMVFVILLFFYLFLNFFIITRFYLNLVCGHLFI